MNAPSHEPATEVPVGLRQTVASVLAAFFGVQNSRNRKRDFARGNPWTFFAVALLLTGVFAGAIWIGVQLLLARAGL
jgi:hypothetical protein